MPLAAIIYILIVAGLLGFTTARIWPGDDSRSRVTGWLCGISLAPAFVSLLELALYQSLPRGSMLVPVLLLTPIVIAAALARFGFRITPGEPAFPSHVIDHRKAILILLFMLLAFGSLVGLLIHNATTPQVDHDLLVYLTEAKNIYQQFTTGTATVEEAVVRQPHSLSYSSYLAWGFLFESAPGFGNDMTPKALIALNHLFLLTALAGLILGVSNWYWAVVASAAVVMNPIFDYQVNYFARDTFYAAPSIALLALLLYSRSGLSVQRILYAGITLLATFGTIYGHSLGLIGSGAILLGATATRMMRERRLPLDDLSVWASGLVIAVVASIQMARLVGDDTVSESGGFAFPFYSDPFIRNAFEQSSSWGAAPDLLTLASKIMHYNGIGWLLILAGVSLLLHAVLRSKPLASPKPPLRDIIISSAIGATIILLTAAYLPLDLDGLTLASAFASNLRYGFLIGILFIVMLVSATQYAISMLSDKVSLLLGFLVLITISLLAYSRTRDYWPSSDYETRAAFSRQDVCDYLNRESVRIVYTDGDDFLYICPKGTRYIFTREGARILSLIGDDAIRAELEVQQVDAVLLKRSIPYWWQGSRLYGFLKRNWKQVPTPFDQLFVRPKRSR